MNLDRSEVEEVSQIVEKHTAYTPLPLDSVFDWKQTVAVILTIIAMSVGAALWASNAHASIKDWTAEQDFVTKTELREVIKEQYVPRHEFVVVREKLDNTEEKLDTVQKTLDKLSEKLDKIRDGQNRGRRIINTNSD